MNKKTRKDLGDIFSRLTDIRAELEAITYDEEEKFGNMPENLQGSEKYEKMEQGVEALTGITDDLQTACDSLEELINQ